MSRRGESLLVACALVVWCVAIIVKLAHGLPLGHDEAAFTVGAQRWLAGAPEVLLSRSVGTELLAMPGVALEMSAPWIRVGPALASLLVPLGVFAVARSAFPDRRLGGWAAAVIATAHPMLLRASEVLSDLPAAGLILVGLAIFLRELERPEGATWRTLVAVGAFAAAFYVRYGSAPALAAIVVSSAICYPTTFFRRRMLVLLSGGAAIAALPYALFSYLHTGTLLGVLKTSASSTHLEYVGQGLITYLTVNPLFYGVVVAPLAVLGIVGTFALGDRSARCLGLAALMIVIALGLRSHAQPRYAFLFLALLVVNGTALVERFTRPRWRRGLAVAALIAVGTGWFYGISYVIRSSAAAADSLERIAALGEAIRRHSGGRPCVLEAVRVPQLAYYSGCIPWNWPDAPAVQELYLVSLPGFPADATPDGVPLAGTNGAVMIVKR